MPRMTQEVKWGEDNPIENAPELTEEERHAVDQRMRALDKLLRDSGKAKYKLELFLGGKRSMREPTKGILSFWESGTKLHGGGDEKVYICPGKRLKRSDCEAIIPATSNGYGHLVCSKCGTVWKGEEVIGEHIGNYTMRTWADILYTYFRRLDHNCDIYLKHAPDDIRSVVFSDLENRRHGATITKLRARRALHIYPLKNIIKDTSAGADILSRFFAFLTA